MSESAPQILTHAAPSRRKREVTFAGIIFISITFFVMIAAMNSQNNLLFWAFGLMLGGIVIAYVGSWAMLRRLDVRRSLADYAVSGQPLQLQYILTNRKHRLPCFAIGITETRPLGPITRFPSAFALHLAPGQTVTVMSQLVPAQRGLITLPEIRLSCSFPFGFLRHAVLVPRPQSVVVYPRIGVLNRRLALRYREAVTTGTMTSNIRGGCDEFYGLREYRPGDNVRSIHWKYTARTGEIMVRELTSNAPPQMVIVLNLRNWRTLPDGAALAERAIELAASLVCYGSVENFAVALAIAGDPDETVPVPVMGRESRRRHLHHLAVLDRERIEPTRGLRKPGRVTSRAEWLYVTLARTDDLRDLKPATAGARGDDGSATGGGPGAFGNLGTVLAVDDPDSANWLHFLTHTDAHRLLRESPVE